MFRYFVLRLLGLVPTMLLVTVCVFFFVHLLPGDPAQLAAGPEADEETVQMVRERLGLDRPLPEQFVLFVKKTVTGDFGISIRSQRPVIDEVADRFGPTLLLTVAAMGWAVVFGLLIGVVSAVKRGRWPDRLGMAFAVSGISMPPFALGILLMEVFSVWLGWFPTVGAESWRHYVLPSITLGAGLAAAITALEKGAKVAILEKLGMPGGNTMVSGGGMNGAVVEEAKKAGIEDSPKLHTEQTLAAGDFRADPALVAQYAEKMPETVEWFRKLGVTFTPIYQIYGGLWPRCRNPQGQKGYAYIEAMLKRLKELKGEVLTGHKVTAFIRENPSEGRVLGVEVEVKGKKEYWRATKGVVATAGGYAYNAEMCAYFDPRLTKLSTTNQPGATGEVLVAMQDIGALAIGLDYIQCIPGTAPGYKSKGNLIQVIEYSIFVNKEGKRFVAEDSRRDACADRPDRLSAHGLRGLYRGQQVPGRNEQEGACRRHAL